MSLRERVLHWMLDGHVWELVEINVYNPDDSPLYGAISCRCKICDTRKSEAIEIETTDTPLSNVDEPKKA